MFNHCESAPIPIVGEDIVPFTDFLAGLVKKPLAGEPLPAVPKVSRAHSAFSSISPKWQLAKENAEYADFDGSPPPLVDRGVQGRRCARSWMKEDFQGRLVFPCGNTFLPIHPEGAMSYYISQMNFALFQYLQHSNQVSTCVSDQQPIQDLLECNKISGTVTSLAEVSHLHITARGRTAFRQLFAEAAAPAPFKCYVHTPNPSVSSLIWLVRSCLLTLIGE